MFDNNFGECGPIFKILSPVDSQENSPCIRRFPLNLQYVATLPSENWQSRNVADFDNITVDMFVQDTLNTLFILSVVRQTVSRLPTLSD